MNKARVLLLCAVVAILLSCETTNSANLYDPNASVAAIDISTAGSVDPSARIIALPPGTDDLLSALTKAFTDDGWSVSTNTTRTRYVMLLQTKVWSYNQRLSAIDLSIVDQKTGAKILAGMRKTYSPNDKPIDVTAVAQTVVASLKKITAPGQGSSQTGS